MMELLTTLDWGAVVQIIIIDILLGGDNAVVIALACRNLPPQQRTKGILWGTAGAIILRVVLIAFAVALLQVPLVKLIGGALLIWIGVKLLAPGDEGGHDKLEGAGNLAGAIKTIIVADLVMSVDNVIAIAGAAQQADPEHQLGLVIFGLLVSIPLIVWGSQLVLKLIDRFPFIVLAGGALLGWIAGGMMLTDPLAVRWVGEVSETAVYIASAVGAGLVVLLGEVVKRTQRRGAAGHG